MTDGTFSADIAHTTCHMQIQHEEVGGVLQDLLWARAFPFPASEASYG